MGNSSIKKPKPPKRGDWKKKLRKWVEIQEKAKLNAQYRWKNTKKGFLASLRAHIGRIIDNSDLHDVCELIAVLSLTPVVKYVIDTSEDIRAKIQAIISAPEEIQLKRLFGFGLPTWELIPKQITKIVEAKSEGLFPDWMDWIIAFGFSYLIVHNFGAIVHAAGDIVKSIRTIIGSLLAS